MKHTIFTSIILLFLTICVNGQRRLSENSKISVLTCSQGNDLYAAFGHSAIRVSDSDNDIDWVFNYGTFDFNTPNFYLKFANGKLNYMISIGDFKRFLPGYFKENRSVSEQVLNLNLEDRQHVFDALIVNYQPENRNYKYDFFYDNCATRILDIITSNISGKVILNPSGDEANNITFRKYLNHYLNDIPWVETGLNTILGLPADKIATLKESTYLPDFLMFVLDKAMVLKEDGSSTYLVKENNVLLDITSHQKENKFEVTPVILFWFVLIIGVILSLLVQHKIMIWFDRLLFSITGFIGIIISYLWLVTDHSVTGNNLNIFWAIPTFLYLIFVKNHNKIAIYVFKLNLLSLVIFLIFWNLLPQAFPIATIPIALLLAFRIVMRLRRIRANVI